MALCGHRAKTPLFMSIGCKQQSETLLQEFQELLHTFKLAVTILLPTLHLLHLLKK